MWAAWRNKRIAKKEMKVLVESAITEILKDVDTCEREGYTAFRVDMYGVSDTKKRYLFKRLRQLGFVVIHHYGYKYLITW